MNNVPVCMHCVLDWFNRKNTSPNLVFRQIFREPGYKSRQNQTIFPLNCVESFCLDFNQNTALSFNKCHCNKLQNRTFIAYFRSLCVLFSFPASLISPLSLIVLHSCLLFYLRCICLCHCIGWVFLFVELKPKTECNILTTNTFQIVNLFGSKLSGYKSKSFCS